jgi:hypothetical protein
MVQGVTVHDKSLVAFHAQLFDIPDILGKVRAGPYFGMRRLDLLDGKHNFIFYKAPFCSTPQIVKNRLFLVEEKIFRRLARELGEFFYKVGLVIKPRLVSQVRE